MRVPKVIRYVVQNDLCTGCGLCILNCPEKSLTTKWNENGFIVPEQTGLCNNEGKCILVCPFNPFPEKALRTENEIADFFLQEPGKQHKIIGKFIGIYAGYSPKFRITSSSGGIATFILTELLDKGNVNHVVSVKESSVSDVYFEYSISSTKEELIEASGTRYFPVTLGNIMDQFIKLDGKIAIVGVACFIKAIRLLQYYKPEYRDRIPFLVGIICGGIKSRYFTEYLAEKAGASRANIRWPNYRIKNLNSTALDYSFSCKDSISGEDKLVRMRSLGDMWGTGFFKANACDFCDDVSTELSDISLGDAWIKPFINDGKGTNIFVTRSPAAENLIVEGVRSGELIVEILSMERFLEAQRGSINHRHLGLSYRIKLARRKKIPIPPKRFENEKISFGFKLVQKNRRIVRAESLNLWRKSSEAREFEIAIGRHLKNLSLATNFYHHINSLRRFLLTKNLR